MPKVSRICLRRTNSLARIIDCEGICREELGKGMTDAELQEMMDEADRDGDGEVNEEEFLPIMKKTNLF